MEGGVNTKRSPWEHVSGKVYSYPLFRFDGDDAIYFVVWFVAYFLAHGFTNKFIVKPLSKFVVHKDKDGEIVNGAPPSKDELLKFETTTWRFLYYCFNLIVGIFLLKDEEWITYPEKYFENWPAVVFPSYLRMYYIMQFSCYSYQSVLLFVDKKQKDFVQMLVHHITTLLLIFFSFEIGFYRIGCVILILMDIGDPLLELAKNVLYCGYTRTADFVFSAFTIIFFFSRNFLYPFYVVHSGMFSAYATNGEPVPYKDVFVVGLFILQGLFLFWGGLIIKIMVLTYVLGQGSARSDIRDIDEEEEKKGEKKGEKKKLMKN